MVSTVTVCKEPFPKQKSSDTKIANYVVIRLPWIGNVSKNFKSEISAAILKACPTVTPVVSFTTRQAFNGVHKDVLPMTLRSFIVYNYKCYCGRQYVGKTTQVLSERIKQHVPHKRVGKTELQNDSAITKHLRQNVATCTRDDDQTITKQFQVLTQARSRSHLDVLEAIYILSIACQQKSEFTQTLKLV